MSVRKLLRDISLSSLSSSLPPSSSSDSPALSPFLSYEPDTSLVPHFFIPSVPVAENVFDLITLPIITTVLYLSLLSLIFVIYLRVRSRFVQHLQHFTTLWTVRSIIIFFSLLWTLNETLRLSFFRQNYLFPFSQSLTLNQQAGLCKLHVALSLGFFEPGFLITLLFLVNVSIRKRFPSRMWALASICVGCSPVFTLQIIFVFFTPFKERLPSFMYTSYVVFLDSYGKQTVLCKYPLLSTTIFGAFTVGYLLVFVISCYKVVEFVINKNLQSRINMLASTVMATLPLQLLFLAMSPFWSPGGMVSGGLVLAAFVCFACCLLVGQFVLIIKPVTETLSIDGSLVSCRGGDSAGTPLRQLAEDR